MPPYFTARHRRRALSRTQTDSKINLVAFAPPRAAAAHQPWPASACARAAEGQGRGAGLVVRIHPARKLCAHLCKLAPGAEPAGVCSGRGGGGEKVHKKLTRLSVSGSGEAGRLLRSERCLRTPSRAGADACATVTRMRPCASECKSRGSCLCSCNACVPQCLPRWLSHAPKALATVFGYFLSHFLPPPLHSKFIRKTTPFLLLPTFKQETVVVSCQVSSVSWFFFFFLASPLIPKDPFSAPRTPQCSSDRPRAFPWCGWTPQVTVSPGLRSHSSTSR